MINAFSIANFHECSQIASKRLQKIGQAKRFVMEVNATKWPAGCILNKDYKTIWWNRAGLVYERPKDKFNRICKYRKYLVLSF